MALNVRFLQKAGVAPAEAVTGDGPQRARRRHRAHRACSSCSSRGPGERAAASRCRAAASCSSSWPCCSPCSASSIASRRGRRIVRTRVLRHREAVAGDHRLDRPLAAADARAVRRIDGRHARVHRRARVRRATRSTAAPASPRSARCTSGSSILAAAAPTPGGLGAMEAALVAGFTAIGMDGADRRRGGAQLPPGDVLVADPSRVDQLPAARAAQLHLTLDAVTARSPDAATGPRRRDRGPIGRPCHTARRTRRHRSRRAAGARRRRCGPRRRAQPRR